MSDFLSNLLLIILGTSIGGLVAAIFIIEQFKRNFFLPKLYIKKISVIPVKGDITKDKFMWGGVVYSIELQNDSDHWAYNLHIKDLYAEFRANKRIDTVNKIPLSLASELPRINDSKYIQRIAGLPTLKPGEKIKTNIRIISKTEITIPDCNQLTKELNMIKLRARVVYENASGHRISTYFISDFHQARHLNVFRNGLFKNRILKKWHHESPRMIMLKSKIAEIKPKYF